MRVRAWTTSPGRGEGSFAVALAIAMLSACGASVPIEAHESTPAPSLGAETGGPHVDASVPAPDPATLDRDGDRIADAIDACPLQNETFNGTDDEDGCPDCASSVVLTEAWSLEPIGFPARSAELLPTRDLDFDVAVLRAHLEMHRVVVTGYAAYGERAHGEALARTRAEAVVAALVARGISADRLALGAPRVARGPGDAAGPSYAALEVVEAGPPRYPLCNDPFPGCRADALHEAILVRVQFARGRDVWRPNADRVLNAVAQTLIGNPQITGVEVQGFQSARERGDDALALRRARAVVLDLVARGVDPSRLRATSGGVRVSGHGEEDDRVATFTELETDACRLPTE